MPSTYVFTQEKLKRLVELFLNTGANFDEKFPNPFKKPMRVIMNENIPSVFISDGYFSIDANFTKEAIMEYKRNYSHIKFSALRDKILFLQKWSLHLRQTDSSKVFNSYNNLTVYVQIDQFKPITQEIPSARQITQCKPIFKDDSVRAIIDKLRHNFVSNLIDTKVKSVLEDETQLALGTLKMPSLKDVFKPKTMGKDGSRVCEVKTETEDEQTTQEQ